MPEFTPRNAPSPTNAINEVLGFGIVIAVEKYIVGCFEIILIYTELFCSFCSTNHYEII